MKAELKAFCEDHEGAQLTLVFKKVLTVLKPFRYPYTHNLISRSFFLVPTLFRTF